LRRGDPPATVLDDRFVEAFAIAGSPTDFIELARHYRAAGVTELVLTFAGPEPEADMMCLSEAMKLQASAV
jgi:5,10-methylenetetrahydromethanopterin reductase